MKKLNKRKIRWIVREMRKREVGAWTIATAQEISPQHVRKVYSNYKDEKDPILLRLGRKPREITEQEKKLVIQTYKEFRVGATMIEQILDEKGIHINHNRIQSKWQIITRSVEKISKQKMTKQKRSWKSKSDSLFGLSPHELKDKDGGYYYALLKRGLVDEICKRKREKGRDWKSKSDEELITYAKENNLFSLSPGDLMDRDKGSL